MIIAACVDPVDRFISVNADDGVITVWDAQRARAVRRVHPVNSSVRPTAIAVDEGTAFIQYTLHLGVPMAQSTDTPLMALDLTSAEHTLRPVARADGFAISQDTTSNIVVHSGLLVAAGASHDDTMLLTWQLNAMPFEI